MAGLLYKEFILHKKALWTTAGVTLVMTIYILLMSATSVPEDMSELTMIFTVIYFMLFFFVGFIQTEFLRKDENVKWCGFVTSTPKAAKGQVQSKYYIVLIANVVMVSWLSLVDSVAAALGASSLAMMLHVLFWGQLLINSIEFPFSLRFGVNKGTNIKMGIVMSIVLAAIIYGLFGDISFLTSDDAVENIAAFFTGDGMSKLGLWFIGLLPWVSLAAYILSCRLSEKLYLKGVESYDG
ncbi:MAG: ABC-2 transporter permease [Ruminococcaceae bacterium]|nr:ABC-2 transporter permease [Oscillospiraceae bacterium]